MIISFPLHVSTGSISKRDVKEGPFKPEDVYITSGPKEVDREIEVEYAVVHTSADGNPLVVPSEFLVDATEKKAAVIEQKLGGTVMEIRSKSSPITDKPTSGSTGKSTALIVGVAVAAVLIAIIAAVAICYFRLETCTFLG